MAESPDPRVAVYLDFDNIVMSWYDRVHGRNAYSRDRQRLAEDPTTPDLAERLSAATVDVGAIIDYAASFGSIMLTRAYADWSTPMNAEYRSQLVARAVDLVQLFPAAAYAKNGADIRLAVDAVEDMFRIDSLTHVVIVAGDSDYVPLAQRCKRLGCHVVGVGVAGSTAKSLAAACDEFESYENLPEVELPPRQASSGRRGKGSSNADRGHGGGAEKPELVTAGGKAEADAADAGSSTGAGKAEKAESSKSAAGKGRRSGRGSDGANAADGGAAKGGSKKGSTVTEAVVEESVPGGDDNDLEQLQAAGTRLLQRAMRLGDREDTEWLHSSAVKTYMRRMDPSFSEKALGHRSFSSFLKANSDIVELSEDGHERLVRMRED